MHRKFVFPIISPTLIGISIIYLGISLVPQLMPQVLIGLSYRLPNSTLIMIAPTLIVFPIISPNPTLILRFFLDILFSW